MEKLIVSPSPHLKQGDSTKGIMLDVIISLMPAAIASGIIFGARALFVIAICVISCVLTEHISCKILKKESTINDLSAIVTGILLAFNLPVQINPVIAVIGSVVAIAVVKQMFGGIGQNFVNPAITARIVLMASFPTAMSTWVRPFYYLAGDKTIDAVTTASPLALASQGSTAEIPSMLDMFIGNRAGCLGETCSVALILGGIYLVLRGVISPIIPVTFVATVAAGTLILGGDVIFSVLSGGLLLGAIFMATDYTTSPITRNGKLIFGIGCGLITLLIRNFGALPEGVSFSIIIMNILVPHIEKLTAPKPFGEEELG